MSAFRRCTNWAGIIGLVAFLTLAKASPVSALVTDYSIDHSPVYFGQNLTYSLVNDGNNPIAGSKWEYACANEGCTGNYLSMGTGAPITVGEGVIGTFNVRVTVSYGTTSGGGNPPQNTVITHTVTILAPTSDKVKSGNNTVLPSAPT